MQTIDTDRLAKVTNQRFRQHFHIQTLAGWLNDPNGLCYYQGYYHVFYQFHPYSADWGLMHWGHVRSKDLVHWERLPIALVPGDPEDSGGCFSGSAMVKDGRLYLIYTGHHYYGDGDLDHFWENENVAYSDDGIHFTKYSENPVISAPADNTKHFRDPKVWQYDGHYFLVLGSQEKASQLGRILLYESTDLLHWQLRGPIMKSHGAETEGFMFECPDFFRVNGQDILACSPMGIKAQQRRFLNENQVVYHVGQLDYQTPQYHGSAMQEVDFGHNFYAPQSFLTPDGRRIQFGWMSSFDDPMPEKADGWAGCLTVPREVVLNGDRLGTVPIRELQGLRTETLADDKLSVDGETTLAVTGQQAEIHLVVPEKAANGFTWALQAGGQLLVSLTYDQAGSWLTVHQAGKESDRYAQVPTSHQLDLQMIIDTSSVEIFVNHGAATFTERYYTEQPVKYTVKTATATRIQLQAYRLTENN